MQIKYIMPCITCILGITIWLSFTTIATRSPATFLRQMLTPQNGKIIRSLFTPKDNIRQTLVELINNEKLSIKVAIYFLTDDQIATALKKAKKRGVEVTIVTDAKHVEKCPHTKIIELHQIGIPIRVYDHKKGGLMHHKFLILEKNINDQPILSTGSYNFTNSAQLRNRENVTITDNPNTIRSYTKEFKNLQNASVTLDSFLRKIQTN
jgi:phosphatidylserine/phosphatidylglycerophosphate/cardiolipin synthase-like enzyme